jgi:hypothetical protein
MRIANRHRQDPSKNLSANWFPAWRQPEFACTAATARFVRLTPSEVTQRPHSRRSRRDRRSTRRRRVARRGDPQITARYSPHLPPKLQRRQPPRLQEIPLRLQHCGTGCLLIDVRHRSVSCHDPASAGCSPVSSPHLPGSYNGASTAAECLVWSMWSLARWSGTRVRST